MHKCANLPHYKQAGADCLLTVEKFQAGVKGCIDWNKVNFSIIYSFKKGLDRVK